jgi:hypothetical protein
LILGLHIHETDLSFLDGNNTFKAVAVDGSNQPPVLPNAILPPQSVTLRYATCGVFPAWCSNPLKMTFGDDFFLE